MFSHKGDVPSGRFAGNVSPTATKKKQNKKNEKAI